MKHSVFSKKVEDGILLQVGVKIFLRNKEGKYLILKRSPVQYPQIANFWDIPGGRIVPGTGLLDNLKREVFEETKLPVLGITKLICAQDIIYPSEKHIVRLTFCGTTSGEPVLDEEHVEHQWITLVDMKSLPKLDEFTKEVLERHHSAIA